jgi:hypothetical protein
LDLPLRGNCNLTCPSEANTMQLKESDSWCRYRKRNHAMLIKRLLDGVERRGDIGRRVIALVLPISNRARMTSSCTGKIGLREPGEHTSSSNLASRNNVAHNPDCISRFWNAVTLNDVQEGAHRVPRAPSSISSPSLATGNAAAADRLPPRIFALPNGPTRFCRGNCRDGYF